MMPRDLGPHEIAVDVDQLRRGLVAMAFDEGRVATQIGEQKAAIGSLVPIS